jgi:hypothetical protein
MTLENELFAALDRVVHQDYSNPQRINSPGHFALQKLAAEPEAARSASILVYMRQCAPCFDELRELRWRQLLHNP